MSNSTLEHNMDNVFTHWPISEEPKQDFELYQPNKIEEDNLPASDHAQEGKGTPSTPQELGTSKSGRTFKNRPGDSKNTAFTALDDISMWHFFSFFNALGDRVMHQLTLPSQAILFALFRMAHGFNRNWCQMSISQLERKTGASRNTIRKHLKTLIEAGWICILSDGYHEATTYGLCIPGTIKETWTEEEEETPLPAPACDQADISTEQRGTTRSEIPDLSACAEAELNTPMSPDIEDPNPNPPMSPLLADKQSEAVPTGRRADDTCQQPTHNQATHNREQTVRGSTFDRQKLPPCTGTYTELKTGKKPDSHPWEYSQDYVRTDTTPDPEGENRVIDNQKDKKYRESLVSTKPNLEESYLKSLPGKKVGEIYRAQDAWDEILGPDTRPTAAKLDQMLQYMRGWYRGDNLDVKFRWCLGDTKEKRPRDAVAWLISALKHGRYPNIVMSKPRWEGTGSSSPRPKTSMPQSGNNPGKAPDARTMYNYARAAQRQYSSSPGLDRPGQTREATAEREKRRAASPHKELWEKVLKDIGEKILPQSYESWFKPLFIAEIGDTAVVFDAPDQMVADWVEQNYMGLLKTALKTVGLYDRSIVIEHL